jgi:hypothetical protein
MTLFVCILNGYPAVEGFLTIVAHLFSSDVNPADCEITFQLSSMQRASRPVQIKSRENLLLATAFELAMGAILKILPHLS